MKLEITTPDQTLFKGEVELVQLPGIDGSFEILDNHAPMISVLKKGYIKIIIKKDEEDYYEVKGGVVEVIEDRVLVLAE
ncbi:MAG: ATP synthase F1 subunit epsilon [Bacteroidales bacterium]|nr:ATP synthase F1 subunit epsilon [Bacteroidales bacterium]